ncbi:MAG: EAL domain-containing protein [Clostridiales bacterium]|nr:EAL domain-containing protein [Clostridiales bacterium]
MIKGKKTVIYTAVILYFIGYFIVTIAHSDFWGNILSPLGTFASAVILFNVYKKSSFAKKSWLLISIAVFSWCLTDLLWAFWNPIFGINPEDSLFIAGMYVVTNVFLLLAVIVFLLPQVKKWNRVQLILDSLAATLTYVILIWGAFLNKDLTVLSNIDAWDVITVAYLFIDVLIITGITIWYFSMRRRNVSRTLAVTILSILLFSVTDITYAYLDFYNLYIPNSLIDSVYMFSMLLMAHAGDLVLNQNDLKWYRSFAEAANNVGMSRKGWSLLAAPVILILLRGFDIQIIIRLVIIFVVYQALSGYVQNALKDKMMLEREKEHNLLLEERINERTKELLVANEELDFISKQDYITNIYNRRHFISELDALLQEAGESEPVVVYYIDLDRFKAINDSFGHNTGDEVLIELSRRLVGWNTFNALLARLGGDEFVFAFRGKAFAAQAEIMAKDLIEKCREPIYIGPYEFTLSLSIGITIYPKDADSRIELMKNADIAMYHAKARGFNNYAFFNSDMDERMRRKNLLEHLMKKADFNSEFSLEYQPQFSVPDGRLVGMEALVRWNNPEEGSVTPSEFIPIAEETGMIVALGEWIISKATSQIAVWNTKYGSSLKMGINISPKQLDGSGFVRRLMEVMRGFDVPAAWLDIEITESIAMKGETTMEEIFESLADNGLTTSIDDFGTGYSSLSYIKQFSFDRLKIAKQLIDSIASEFGDTQIVAAIVMMAKALGIKTIAEGVETDEQLAMLISLGCEEVQGYVFSRPLSPERFEELFLSEGCNPLDAYETSVSDYIL